MAANVQLPIQSASGDAKPKAGASGRIARDTCGLDEHALSMLFSKICLATTAAIYEGAHSAMAGIHASVTVRPDDFGLTTDQNGDLALALIFGSTRLFVRLPHDAWGLLGNALINAAVMDEPEAGAGEPQDISDP